MVSYNGIFVYNEITSYETYSSSSGYGGKRFVISAKRKYNGILAFTKWL